MVCILAAQLAPHRYNIAISHLALYNYYYVRALNKYDTTEAH